MADLSQLLLLAQLGGLGLTGGQGLTGMLAGGGGIPSPDQLQWQRIEANASAPQKPAVGPLDPNTQYQDPNMQTPDAFAQQYADKQNRNALIQAGIGGLAGLLTPSYGPYGRRSWLGQIGQGLNTGLGAYSAAEQAQALDDYRQGQLAVGTAKAGAANLNNAIKNNQGERKIDLQQQALNLRKQIFQAGNWQVFTDSSDGLAYQINTKDPNAVPRPIINPSTGKQMSGKEALNYAFIGTDAGVIVGNRKTGAASAPIPGTGRASFTPVPTASGIVPFNTKTGTTGEPSTTPSGAPVIKSGDPAAEAVKVQQLYKNEHPLSGAMGYMPTAIGPANGRLPEGSTTKNVKLPDGSTHTVRVINGTAYIWD